MISRYTLLGLSIALFLASVIGRAGTVLVDASVSGTTAAFSYAYEVENQTAVGLLAFSLTVRGDVGTIASPTGWVVGTGVFGPGETLVQWVSTDVP